MELHVGDVVYSRAGRDQGRYFLVIELVDEQYVLITDGKLRRLETPKRKKVKHLKALPPQDLRICEKVRNGEKLTNSEIRREMASLSE